MTGQQHRLLWMGSACWCADFKKALARTAPPATRPGRYRAPEAPPDGQRARYGDLQAVCRLLVSAALSMRGVNTFVERQMVLRQGLYRRRWARATPPVLPDQSGSTLWFTGELGLFIELPSLGSEHDLPLARNTIPYLPAPAGLPRGRHRGLEMPPTAEEHARGFRTPADDVEIIDGELVGNER